jgi:hypothetical protein
MLDQGGVFREFVLQARQERSKLGGSPGRSQTIEAKMWAGKMFEGLGKPFPAELADKANVQ